MITTEVYCRAKARVRAQSGETLVETLVSLLIGTFALLLLAAAIASSIDIIRSSSAKMTELYNVESSMIGREPLGGSNTVIFGIPLELNASGSPKNIAVNVYVSNPDVSADETYAYYEKG